IGLAGPLPLGPGWAIGGWFIPIAGYVLGPLQLHHAAAASDPRRGVGAGGETRPGRVPGVLIAWWATFVAGSTVFFVGQVMRPSNDGSLGLAEYLRDVQSADRLVAVAALVYAAAAVLATLTVRVLSERQDAAIERRFAPGVMPPR
ncbi:MAG: DUF4328 domain-containing protein, partial [Chloroflexi bacterium]|nr:DUF4328 domain-containing protein [Chloroflexota bacterium]